MGKTKVLTARVAYLLIEHLIMPEHIIVTTFTKKAANEMKERLSQMLEGTNVKLNKLIIGTFHSICTRILMQYGYTINLKRFRIAADRDWNDIMKAVIDPITDDIADVRDLIIKGELNGGKKLHLERSNGSDKAPYDIKKVRKQISTLKSKGLYPEDYSRQHDYNTELHRIFKTFQEKLEENGLLDFDDILVKTNLLLLDRNCVNNIRHVLIDEFQDTNTIQLELMVRFAMGASGNMNNITVVGDPDQSIYRFRDAVSVNFDLMMQKYPNCNLIKLNENYRSTSDVLNFSEAVMCQQSSRVAKSLKSQFTHSFPAVYQSFDSRDQEALYIAEEIKFLKSLPGLFQNSDFAILIRAAYQSRALEKALVKMKISYKIVKGRAFWERTEIEQLTDLLRLVAYDDDKIALLRTLARCITGMGQVTLKKVEKIIDDENKKGSNALGSLSKISVGDLKGVNLKIQDQFRAFLKMISEARSYVSRDRDSVETLSSLFEFLKTQKPLASLIKEEERAQNVEELKSQLLDFKPTEIEPINFDDDEPIVMREETILESFLASIQLDFTDDKESANENGQVFISTIHSSKGLEWPVVFIPGLVDGSLPASFAMKDENEEEALDEERRIFYVSTTRAKQLLYITNALGGNNWGTDLSEPSRFLTNQVKKMMRSRQVALSNLESIKKLYGALNIGHDETDSVKVSSLIAKYEQSRNQKTIVSPRNDSFSIPCDGLVSSTRMGINSRNPSYGGFQYQSASRMKTEVETLPAPGVKKFAPVFSKVRATQSIGNGKSVVKEVIDNRHTPFKRRKTLGVRRRMPS